MSTIESIPDSYRVTAPGSLPYEISLEVHGGIAQLTISGSLRADAADALTGIIGCTDAMQCPLHVCADGVTSADLDGLEPIFNTARMRAARGMPPIQIDSASGTVWQLIRTLLVGSDLPAGLVPLVALAYPNPQQTKGKLPCASVRASF